MDRNDQPDRRWTDSDETHDTFEDAPNDREPEVMGAYDEIDGESMFIIAAIDSDHAWIAISDAAEVDPTNWC